MRAISSSVLAWGLLVALAAGVAGAQPPAPGAEPGCRAVGQLNFDVAKMKITAVPQHLEVTAPNATDSAREVCFAWTMVGGSKSDKFDQLVLEDFDGVRGHGGRPVFKAKRLHGSGGSLISLEFDDAPDFDANHDGVFEDVVVAYGIAAKFKGKAVTFDPDIIIKKPGG